MSWMQYANTAAAAASSDQGGNGGAYSGEGETNSTSAINRNNTRNYVNIVPPAANFGAIMEPLISGSRVNGGSGIELQSVFDNFGRGADNSKNAGVLQNQSNNFARTAMVLGGLLFAGAIIWKVTK